MLGRKEQMEPPSSGARGPRGARACSRIRRRPRSRPRHPLRHPPFHRPSFSRALARGAFEAHRRLLGKGGIYVRLPIPAPVRFRDTALMAIGPFAIDVLLMAEVLYLLGAADLRQLQVGLVAFPILLLAGLLTSLIPGAW